MDLGNKLLYELHRNAKDFLNLTRLIIISDLLFKLHIYSGCRYYC
jgi:hypothetical protein